MNVRALRYVCVILLPYAMMSYLAVWLRTDRPLRSSLASYQYWLLNNLLFILEKYVVNITLCGKNCDHAGISYRQQLHCS